MKIYLIGMPGSGKTTLGKQVAEQLQLPFVDLDHEIEAREGRPIPEIFSTEGETYFRSVESETLAAWAASDKTFVMATGGGAPCFYKGIEVINNTGISVFLDVPLEQLVERVEKNTDRPLLLHEDVEALKQKLKQLLQTRTPIYKQARLHVHDAGLTGSGVVAAIKSLESKP
jgi:shikimate kinase